MTDFNYQDQARRSTTGSQPTVPLSEFPTEQARPPIHQLSSANSYSDLQYLFGVQDPTMLAPKPNRNRRKSNHGPEHIKHRRTRSGCYTCRSRRVKCDEAHPICERCKKGGRDCIYPETSTPSKAASGASSKTAPAGTHESPGSSSDDFEDEAGPERLESIPGGDEGLEDSSNTQSSSQFRGHPANSSKVSRQKYTTRGGSETPSLVQDKGASPTPSTEGSVGNYGYQTVGASRRKQPSVSLLAESGNLRSDWSHLPPDLQFYLTYFYENLTPLHYSFLCPQGDFLRTFFLDAALRNDALLHAVVGFAAFQRTLHNPDGRMQDFLQYYNKAVSLLLNSLKKGERHSNGTILAILQLATIEEYLGDWINLLGHQKAAYKILTELYTPQTVMQNEISRVILGWYMRFDVFAGLLGGFETVLSREWFSFAEEFSQQQVVRDHMDLTWKIELAIAQLRLIAMDMSIVFAKIGKGEITHDQFVSENEVVGRRIQSWKTEMDPALQDSRFLVTDFTGARALDPDDIVDPYLPGTIYCGPLWVMNLCMMDWYSMDLMHKYQTALTMKTQPSAELGLKAYASCQMFEALEFWPGSPPGTILACQASLGIACLFLPRDETHAMWCRRKLATIECNGYIYPYTFRTKMADLFRDRSCMHWWLPNDECYPPIIRSIRKFVEERTAPATDLPGEDLRNMKAIFASLKLDDGKSNLPPDMDKGNYPRGDVAVASGGDWATSNLAPRNMQEAGGISLGEDDAYQLGFEDGRSYWASEGGGTYGVPKTGEFE